MDLSQSDNSPQSFYHKKWVQVAIGVGGTLLLVFLLAGAYVGYLFWQIRSGALPINGPVKDPQSVLARMEYVARAGVETQDDPILGDAEADIVIVEFSDFQCPFCQQSYTLLKELIDESPHPIKVIYRDFPVYDVHPLAIQAAQAGECADDQGQFEAMHDKMFQNQNRLTSINLTLFAQQIGLNLDMFKECLSSGKYQDEVVEDFQDGVAFGVQGTPTWFINGYKFQGVLNKALFLQIIEELAEAEL